MPFDFQRIRYNNNYYAVIRLKYNDTDIPAVVDWDDFQKIRYINKHWKCNSGGFVSCTHTLNNKTKEVFLHDVIMTLQEGGKRKTKNPILHVNRIALDNRRSNLIYDNLDKEINKNNKKKNRTIELPEDSGINVDDIPTYVWYMNPDKTHGARFMVSIGDVNWKTTSSNNFTLKYKLEEAKLFLRQLKEQRPELFEEHSMNGDQNISGKELSDEYYKIINRAGFENIQKIETNNTDKLLKPDLDKKDKEILKYQGDLINKTGGKRRPLCKLPSDCNIKPSDIPEYCYYRPATEIRGDYFIIQNHPDINSWQTSSSRKISTNEKYKEMMDYLKN